MRLVQILVVLATASALFATPLQPGEAPTHEDVAAKGVVVLVDALAMDPTALIAAGGKVVAVLYGDNYPDNRPLGDTDALEIFLSQAGLAMERVLLQRRLQEKGVEGV